MSLHHDHYSLLAARQRRAELVAEADRDRLGRLVRLRRPGPLRRLWALLTGPPARTDAGGAERPASRPRGDPAVPGEVTLSL